MHAQALGCFMFSAESKAGTVALMLQSLPCFHEQVDGSMLRLVCLGIILDPTMVYSPLICLKRSN